MCLTKKSNFTLPLVTTKDIYILKSSFKGAFDSVFLTDQQQFAYFRGIVYTKGWWNKLKAFFREELNEEVFHTYNLATSKRVADYLAKFTQEGEMYGIFIIPKGTKYYEGGSYDVGTFTIEYYGPLTEGNKHLILNQ